MIRIAVAYLIVVNLGAYFTYWLDKRRARSGGRRISERELVAWPLVGGWAGALLAMRRLRHKTQKRSFKLMFVGVALLQIAVIVLIATT